MVNDCLKIEISLYGTLTMHHTNESIKHIFELARSRTENLQFKGLLAYLWPTSPLRNTFVKICFLSLDTMGRVISRVLLSLVWHEDPENEIEKETEASTKCQRPNYSDNVWINVEVLADSSANSANPTITLS